MMTGMVQDQNLEKQIEKQMGCMAGFFQLFDRHQLLTPKKIHSTKRLPPSKVVDAAQSSEESAASSPAFSTELGKPQPANPSASPAQEEYNKLPAPELRPPELLPPKSPLPLPILEPKEGTRSSWKFTKEAPRLSLDSRATVDAKGSLHPRTNASILTANRGDNAGDGDDKQRRSPSLVARLMGLEPLPDSNPEPGKNVELRRSASESRVSRDLFQYRLIDNNNFQLKQPNQLLSVGQNNAIENRCSFVSARPVDHLDLYSFGNAATNAKSVQPKASNGGMVPSPWKPPPQRKSFYDISDVFPEPKQAAVSIYEDVEKRLKLRGIDEPPKDLEILKQILEALQLKGLLRSNRPSEQRNFVYDRSFLSNESPAVVMRPSGAPAVYRRIGNESPTYRDGVGRNSNLAGEYSPSVSPRREMPVSERNVRSPTRTRSDSTARRWNNSVLKPKTLKVETQRRATNESMMNPRTSPAQSPKLSSRRIGQDQMEMNRSPRNRISTAEIYQREKITTVLTTEDESSSISESTFSTSSQTDTGISKMEEYKEGKSLLERCDKLLHSIAEMNATDRQPSPVSVLDSSPFYKDESASSSPSPVMKRSIDFKGDQSSELDEETWSSMFMPVVESKLEDTPEDCDMVYISEVLMASHYLPQDSDVFLLLEKQQYLKGKDTSRVSTLQRRLIFDIIAEILERNRHLPPSKTFSWTDSMTARSSVRKIWSEFQRIRERKHDTAGDLFEVICGVLKKDLAGDTITGWGDYSVEISEVVLDIERLIFKDLIGEIIRDLTAFACKSTVLMAPRRKLVF